MNDHADTTSSENRVVQLHGSERNFERLFDRGMELVEETSLYLDGEGRDASRGLPADIAGQYGSQAMALTTRLMRIASWLLIHRSWLEREIDDRQAMREKETLKLEKLPAPRNSPSYVKLPQDMRDLVERSLDVQRAIIAFSSSPAPAGQHENAVAVQQSVLQSAFR